MKKELGLLVFAASCGISIVGAAAAREISINNTSQLKEMDSAVPGDVIILKNGKWKDAHICIKQGGEPSKPVLIKAETPGKVVLSGSANLVLQAPYVVVDGLFFQEGFTKVVIRFNSHDGIVQNTTIVDYNSDDFKKQSFWVVFEGSSNRVERCYFKGKSNAGPLINNGESNCRYNSVTGSYFKEIPLRQKVNGREIMRIWGAGHKDLALDDGAYFTIADNLFEHADGEGVEIISLKSNFDRILRNTFIASAGGVTIRRGSFCEIKDNVILGQGKAGTSGIRIYGQSNQVQHNFISGCAGSGISIPCGECVDKALTPGYKVRREGDAILNKPHYPQNKFNTISGNVTFGVAGPDLSMGASYKKRWPEQQEVLLPEECRIEKNIFVRPKGGVSVVGVEPDTKPPLDQLKFKPNIYAGNHLYGGTNSYAAAAAGCQEGPIPPEWSEVKALASFKVLTPADVGPDWMRNGK